MRTEKLEDLAQATDALYLREFEKIKPLLERETALRHDLARLDAHAVDARRQYQAADAMRAVGADLLWQGWVARTRRQLNIELARVMAQKLTALSRTRKAFGRKEAVVAMVAADLEARKDKARKRFEAGLLDQRLTGPQDGGDT